MILEDLDGPSVIIIKDLVFPSASSYRSPHDRPVNLKTRCWDKE